MFTTKVYMYVIVSVSVPLYMVVNLCWVVAIPDQCQPVWAEHCNTIPYDVLHVHVHACTKPLYYIMYCMYMYMHVLLSCTACTCTCMYCMYMYMHVLNLYTISVLHVHVHACTKPLYHIMYCMCMYMYMHVLNFYTISSTACMYTFRCTQYNTCNPYNYNVYTCMYCIVFFY